MSVKRRIFEAYIAVVQACLNRTRVQDTLHIHYAEVAPAEGIDIISVAFNNLQVVQHQIRLVKKYIQDVNYTHIIVDNSSDSMKRQPSKRCAMRRVLHTLLLRKVVSPYAPVIRMVQC